VGIVEVDGSLQRPTRHGYPDARSEVRRHVVAEFEKQYEELAISRCEVEARCIQIDYSRACVLKGLHGFFEGVQHRLRCRDIWVESAQPYARHAELSALQPVRVHELRVVGGNIRGTCLARSLPAQRDATRCGIAPVGGEALDDTQCCCRVGYRPFM